MPAHKKHVSCDQEFLLSICQQISEDIRREFAYFSRLEIERLVNFMLQPEPYLSGMASVQPILTLLVEDPTASSFIMARAGQLISEMKGPFNYRGFKSA